MMLHIPEVLTRDEVAYIRGRLEKARWQDGRSSAGHQAAGVKSNAQLPHDAPEAAELSAMVEAALRRHPLFVSAAIPHIILTPRFNAYEVGAQFGNHIDGALQNDVGRGIVARTDISTTLFLAEPDEYDGGELIVEDTYGAHEVKLPAGDAILYPSTSLHRVEPVTRGVRLASFLWCQSRVRDEAHRRMLFELDMTVLKLRSEQGDTPEVVSLTGLYHNLLRQWAT